MYLNPNLQKRAKASHLLRPSRRRATGARTGWRAWVHQQVFEPKHPCVLEQHGTEQQLWDRKYILSLIERGRRGERGSSMRMAMTRTALCF